MKRKKWLPYLVSILATFAAAGLSGIATAAGMPAYDKLAKPPLTPPSLVFPIVWSILYLLMAIGAAMVWNTHSRERKQALRLYAVQLAFNCVWSLLFFSLRLYLFSFLWLAVLWVLILAMIRAFSQVNRAAGLMQIPYLLWVAFAGYLNFGIWLLNRS